MMISGGKLWQQDDDDMKWLDIEEIQYPHSDEEDAAEYEFPELEMGFGLRLSERAGVAVDGEAVPPSSFGSCQYMFQNLNRIFFQSNIQR